MIVICDEFVPGADEVSVQAFTREGKSEELPRLSKERIADKLLNLVVKL